MNNHVGASKKMKMAAAGFMFIASKVWKEKTRGGWGEVSIE